MPTFIRTYLDALLRRRPAPEPEPREDMRPDERFRHAHDEWPPTKEQTR